MTTEYRQVAERLRVLHAHDQRARALAAQLRDGPTRLASLVERVREIDKKVQAVEERVRVLRAQVKLRENELKAAEQKVERTRAQSSEVRTNKEFLAFKAELTNYQAEVDRLQGEILKILEVVEQAAKKTEALQAERAQAQARVDEAQRAVDASLADVRAEQEALARGRAALLAGIPPEPLAAYERVLASRGQGVALLEGEYCGGCMDRLTRNDVIAVQNASRLVRCKGCSRIVILPEA